MCQGQDLGIMQTPVAPWARDTRRAQGSGAYPRPGLLPARPGRHSGKPTNNRTLSDQRLQDLWSVCAPIDFLRKFHPFCAFTPNLVIEKLPV